MNIRKFSQELQEIYDEMGTKFTEYQKSSGLSCLAGCGKCCTNPELEASVLEMFPLALRMLDENKLEEWLDRLEASTQNYCVMYEPHSPDGNKGQCTAYKERPSVCRMFGVAGYFDKHHEITLSVCKLIREKYPNLTKTWEANSTEENTPMIVTWSYRMAQIDPALIQDRMPINQAFKKALERVALYAQYQEHS